MSTSTADLIEDLRSIMSWDDAMRVVYQAADRLAEFDAALRGLVGDEDVPCEFDHPGHCLEHHGGFGDNGCWVAIGRKALGLTHSPIAPPR